MTTTNELDLTPAPAAPRRRRKGPASDYPDGTLCLKVGGRFRAATRDEVLDVAARYLVEEKRGATASSPAAATELIRIHCAGRNFETFVVLFLDTRHRLIEAEPLFRGTIDGATIYVREIVRRALDLGAATLLLGHNHPSGEVSPSGADIAITRKIAQACGLLEIGVLDHIIVSNTGAFSFREHGLL